jgi:hypothetical protein
LAAEALDRPRDAQKVVREPHRQWLRAVLVAVEPQDSWTRRFGAARERKDAVKRRVALEKLAAQADVRKLPARSLTQLAGRLLEVKAAASAVRLLRRAQRQYPADFWLNHELGTLRALRPPQWGVRLVGRCAGLRGSRPRSP